MSKGKTRRSPAPHRAPSRTPRAARRTSRAPARGAAKQSPRVSSGPRSSALKSAKVRERSAKGSARRQRRRGIVEKSTIVARAGPVTVREVAELEDLRRELERAANGSPLRWDANPEDVQRSVAQLVLTLVEFIRRLLERQAIRRMESGSLTEGQTENVGRALMKLEETIRDIAANFGIDPDELNLDLGPAGRLI